jgi:hypothetical protein
MIKKRCPSYGLEHFAKPTHISLFALHGAFKIRCNQPSVLFVDHAHVQYFHIVFHGIRLAVVDPRFRLKSLFLCRYNLDCSHILFIDYLRKCHAEGWPLYDSEYNELSDAAQAARDLAGPLEAEYEPLEIQLGSSEHKLQEKYESIEFRFQSYFRLNANPSTQQDMSSEIEYVSTSAHSALEEREWAGLDSRDTELFQGSFIGEIVGIGQLPVRVESNDAAVQTAQGVWEVKHHTKSSDTIEQSAQRQSTSLPEYRPRSEDDTAPSGIPALDELEEPQQQENESREKRMSQTLKGIGSSSVSVLVEYPDVLPDSFSSKAKFHGGDALLLLDNDTDSQSTLSDYLVTFEDVRDRVNRWLLHQLRLSPREVYALRREVIQHLPEDPAWGRLALSQWPNDDMGKEVLSSTDTAVRDRVEPVHMRRPPYSPVRPYPDVDINNTRYPLRRRTPYYEL